MQSSLFETKLGYFRMRISKKKLCVLKRYVFIIEKRCLFHGNLNVKEKVSTWTRRRGAAFIREMDSDHDIG